MSFLSNLFGKVKGDARVGPLIYALYQTVDSRNRPKLKKFLAQAPSGCEIVATYKYLPIQLAQATVSSLQKMLPRGSAVIGGEVWGDGCIIYIKGDIPSEIYDVIRSQLQRLPTGEVSSGYVPPNNLKELP
jgi:hypothetical protein